jgi:hypothetical protein
MPIVIFLIGIVAWWRRHHSQVRMHPWTRFFNGDCASNKLTATTLHAARIAVSTPHRRAAARDSFLGCLVRPSA